MWFFACGYFIQGLVRGFATVAMSTHLLETGLSHSTVATLVAAFYLPWSFKLLWAPLIDSRVTQDHRWFKRFIVWAQVGVGIGLLLLSQVKVPHESWPLLAGLLFATCIFVTIQDVAIDAFAIRVVPPNELATTNGAMQFGRHAGTAAGAAISSFSLATLGFTSTVIGLAASVLLLTLASAALLTHHISLANGNSGDDCQKPKQLTAIAGSTVRTLLTGRVLSLCMIGFFVSLCQATMEFATMPLFLDQFSWSAIEFSWARSYGSILQAAGALFAIVALRPMRNSNVFALGTLAYAIGAISLISTRGQWLQLPSAFLVVAPAATTIAWIGFIAMAMEASKDGYSATLFTTLMALCNLGTFGGSWLSARLHDEVGIDYAGIVLCGGLLMAVSCASYLWIAFPSSAGKKSDRN